MCKYLRIVISAVLITITLILITLHYFSNTHEDTVNSITNYAVIGFGLYFIVAFVLKIPMTFVSGPDITTEKKHIIFRYFYLFLGIIIYIFGIKSIYF